MRPFVLKLYGKVFVGVAGFEPAASCSQSRRDNRATLHPENSICAFSTIIEFLQYSISKLLSGETGTRTLATVTRRQISNLLHYRSGTSPSSRNVFCFAVANVRQHSISHNYFCAFFNLFSIFFFKTLNNQTNRINKNFILNLKSNRIAPKFEFIQIKSKFA
jgi:hypothetical protein